MNDAPKSQDGRPTALEDRPQTDDQRRFSPSAARNKDPILAILKDWLPDTGDLLEIGAGTGEHAVHFAGAFPGVTWRPSDPNPEARASIAAWRAHSDLTNLQPVTHIDVTTDDWTAGLPALDAVLSLNMIHIAPWAAAQGLIAGAGRRLKSRGALILYGPFIRDEVETAPSNLAFNESLKARNPAWGLRRLDDVDALAGAAGLNREALKTMPANNVCVLFRKV